MRVGAGEAYCVYYAWAFGWGGWPVVSGPSGAVRVGGKGRPCAQVPQQVPDVRPDLVGLALGLPGVLLPGSGGHLHTTARLAGEGAKESQDALCHWLEYFAGEAQLTAGMQSKGLRAKAFDVVYNDRADVEHSALTAAGFRYWVLSLCFTDKGADQWHGIVCSSWVFMCRSITKRQLNVNVPARIWGDESQPLVARGNELAVKVTFLCSFGWLHDVGYIIEQPSSSLLPHFPCCARLFACTRAEQTTTLSPQRAMVFSFFGGGGATRSGREPVSGGACDHVQTTRSARLIVSVVSVGRVPLACQCCP